MFVLSEVESWGADQDGLTSPSPDTLNMTETTASARRTPLCRVQRGPCRLLSTGQRTRRSVDRPGRCVRQILVMGKTSPFNRRANGAP